MEVPRAAFVVSTDPITTTAIKAMAIEQPPYPNNAPKAERERPQHRRASETRSGEHRGVSFTMTTGFYPDGRVAEIFLNSTHANSLLDFLMSDAAILVSLALQYGAPLDEIRHALKRDVRGEAASPIGSALDLAP